jgi:hypothetical protein
VPLRFSSKDFRGSRIEPPSSQKLRQGRHAAHTSQSVEFRTPRHDEYRSRPLKPARFPPIAHFRIYWQKSSIHFHSRLVLYGASDLKCKAVQFRHPEGRMHSPHCQPIGLISHSASCACSFTIFKAFESPSTT